MGDLLNLVTGLIDPTGRAEAIRNLSARLGIELLIVFVADPEVGALLPAPGFPQTFPRGRIWRTFLEDCARKGEHRAELSWPDADTKTPARGITSMDGSVLVLLGGESPNNELNEVIALLPLLAASFKGERALATQAAQAAFAAYTERQSAALTRCLDDARRGGQREINARKLAEEEVRRLNQTLEQQVAERTAKLRETVEELEAFSYSVSHDLRSPLRAMQGYASALLENCAPQLDETNATYLRRIHRAASRLDVLTQAVLAYSRVTRAEISLLPVQLEKLVADIIEQYPQLQTGCVIKVHSPLLNTLAHEALLTQCISNLMDNAVKFVAPGTVPKIDVRTEAVGDQVRLLIEDNGIGIDPMHHDRIFQMFGRVHPDKKYEGTGIGLAIVKKAAERMGGGAGFESTPGKGSRFWIRLPKADVPA